MICSPRQYSNKTCKLQWPEFGFEGVGIGTIRVTKWDQITPLPIPKIFNIDPQTYLTNRKADEIYHIGRLAIKKTRPSLTLFKELIAKAIYPICQNKYNMAFAELDVKLFRILSLLGIIPEVIASPAHYLGSWTIPVLLTCKGLLPFQRNYNRQITKANDHAEDFVKPYKVTLLL